MIRSTVCAYSVPGTVLGTGDMGKSRKKIIAHMYHSSARGQKGR